MLNHNLYRLTLFRASATFDLNCETIFVDNGDGITRHHMASAALMASYTGDALHKRNGYPLQSVDGEHSTVVFTGSEKGKIYVFEAKGGSPRDVLEHANTGRVQRVTVECATS
jgi:hypothetical protein